MKISLNSKLLFWGLVNPDTMEISLILNENTKTLETDELKLEEWALEQISDSVKKNQISISVKVEDLLKSKEKEVTDLPVSKTRKKVTRNITKK